MSVLTYNKSLRINSRFVENDFRILNPSEIVVLLTIAMFTNEKRKAFPSVETICKLTNLSNKTVHGSIKSLCEKKYLSKELIKATNNKYKVNEYTLLNNDLNLYVLSPDNGTEKKNRYKALRENIIESNKSVSDVSIKDFIKVKSFSLKKGVPSIFSTGFIHNKINPTLSRVFVDSEHFLENEYLYFKQRRYLSKVKRFIPLFKGYLKKTEPKEKAQNKLIETTLYSNECLYEKINTLCQQVENLGKIINKDPIKKEKKPKDEYSVYFKPLLECYSNWYKETFNSETDNVNHGKDSKHLKDISRLIVGDFRESKLKREPETDFSKYFPQTKEVICLFEKMLVHLQTSKHWILKQMSITMFSSRYSEIKTAMLISKSGQQVESFSKEFEDFWNTYPIENRTEVKSDVYKVFRELSPENQSKAVNGVKSYILDKETKFISNPIKYLNAELWGTVKVKPKVNLTANERRKIMQRIYESIYDGIKDECFKEQLKEYVSPTETTNMNGGLIRIRDIKDNKVNFIFNNSIIPFLKESNTSINTINTIVRMYDINAVAVSVQ